MATSLDAVDTEGGPTTPPWRSRRNLLIGGGIVVVLIIAASVVISIATAGPGTFATRGTMVITGTDVVDNGDGTCSGGLGYNDIVPGTQVVVANAHGDTIAVGQLGQSKLIAEGMGCQYLFTLKSIPAGESFYKVEVSRRGSVQFTEKDMRAGIDLTLGGS